MQKDISLLNLWVRVLNKWKVWLLWAVVIAVVLGAVGAVRAHNDNSEEAIARRQQTYQLELSQFQKGCLSLQSEIDSLKDGISQLEVYRQNSVYYRLDPTQVATAELMIVVSDSGNTAEGSKRLAMLYKQTYNNAQFYAEMADVPPTSLTADDVDELFTVRYAGDNVLRIRAQYDDEEVASDLLNKGFLLMKDTVTTAAGSHTVTVLSSSVYTAADDTVADVHKAKDQRLSELSLSLVDKQDEWQKKQEEEPATPDEKINEVKQACLYAVIGGVIGLLIGLLWVILRYLADSRLDGVLDWEKHYTVPVLAVVGGSGRPSLWQRWIDRLRGEAERGRPAEEALRLINATLSRMADDQSAVVLVTGTVDGDDREAAVQTLNELNGSIRYVGGSCVLTDPSTVEIIAAVDGVVLIERRDASDHKQIARQVARLEQLDKPLLGAILF